MRRAFALAFLLIAPAARGERLTIEGAPELVAPGVVSTEKSEVKVTFSPDGRRMLWGTIGWEGGAGGWDIWESVRESDAWGKPRPVPFNSAANDFDPSFAPDGRGLYLFSNREGGLGGDDIYFVPFDPKTARYGAATNLGPAVNTAGDEWGPVVSPDGQALLFCTNGRGGAGKHDLFASARRNGSWTEAASIGAANTPAEDFDAAFVDGGRAIVFASGDLENGPVTLYVSFRGRDGYSAPTPLPEAVNSKTFITFGCAANPREPGVLYFTSNFEGNSRGRSDIYRVRYRVER